MPVKKSFLFTKGGSDKNKNGRETCIIIDLF